MTSGLVAGTTQILKKHFASLFPAAALVITVAYVAWVAALAALGLLDKSAETPAWVSLVGSVVNGAAYLAVLGIAALVVLRDDDDPAPRTWELIRSAVMLLPALLVAGFMTGSAMFIVGVGLSAVSPTSALMGFIGLVAVIVLLGFAVFVVPALVMEDRSPLTAIGRSISLARSHFFFAVAVALYALTLHLLVSLVLGAFVGVGSSRVAGIAWSILWALATWPVQGVLAAEGFRRLTEVVARQEVAIT